MTTEPPRQTNRSVLDLSKVQWSSFYYKNQYDQCTELKPKHFTVRGEKVTDNERHLNGLESMLAYAKRKGLLDIWVPHITFQLSANHNVTYTGKKALSMQKAWSERVFKSKKK